MSMKPHLAFMLDCLKYDISFSLNEKGGVAMVAPSIVFNSPDEIALIRKHKPAIHDQLSQGFDCVRDGLSFYDKRCLLAGRVLEPIGGNE